MARTAPERTSRASSDPSTFGSCSSRTTASFRPSVSESETTRNGATTPRGSPPATAGLRLDEAPRPAVDRPQPVAQRPDGGPLHVGIERRIHPQAALIDALAAV